MSKGEWRRKRWQITAVTPNLPTNPTLVLAPRKLPFPPPACRRQRQASPTLPFPPPRPLLMSFSHMNPLHWSQGIIYCSHKLYGRSHRAGPGLHNIMRIRCGAPRKSWHSKFWYCTSQWSSCMGQGRKRDNGVILDMSSAHTAVNIGTNCDLERSP